GGGHGAVDATNFDLRERQAACRLAVLQHRVGDFDLAHRAHTLATNAMRIITSAIPRATATNTSGQNRTASATHTQPEPSAPRITASRIRITIMRITPPRSGLPARGVCGTATASR